MLSRMPKYDTYKPAYQYGWESRDRNPGKRYEEVEPELERNWDKSRGTTNLSWEKAKRATRDAWDRVERAIPGDSDRDGK